MKFALILLSFTSFVGFADTITIKTTSDKKQEFTLSFSAQPMANQYTSATFCAPSGKLSKAKLWMPSMGHGSAPVKLSDAGSNCTYVNGMDFMKMAGTWELRVNLDNNDKGVFSFAVN